MFEARSAGTVKLQGAGWGLGWAWEAAATRRRRRPRHSEETQDWAARQLGGQGVRRLRRPWLRLGATPARSVLGLEPLGVARVSGVSGGGRSLLVPLARVLWGWCGLLTAPLVSSPPSPSLSSRWTNWRSWPGCLQGQLGASGGGLGPGCPLPGSGLCEGPGQTERRTRDSGREPTQRDQRVPGAFLMAPLPAEAAAVVSAQVRGRLGVSVEEA